MRPRRHAQPITLAGGLRYYRRRARIRRALGLLAWVLLTAAIAGLLTWAGC